MPDQPASPTLDDLLKSITKALEDGFGGLSTKVSNLMKQAEDFPGGVARAQQLITDYENSLKFGDDSRLARSWVGPTIASALTVTALALVWLAYWTTQLSEGVDALSAPARIEFITDKTELSLADPPLDLVCRVVTRNGRPCTHVVVEFELELERDCKLLGFSEDRRSDPKPSEESQLYPDWKYRTEAELQKFARARSDDRGVITIPSISILKNPISDRKVELKAAFVNDFQDSTVIKRNVRTLLVKPIRAEVRYSGKIESNTIQAKKGEDLSFTFALLDPAGREVKTVDLTISDLNSTLSIGQQVSTMFQITGQKFSFKMPDSGGSATINAASHLKSTKHSLNDSVLINATPLNVTLKIPQQE